MVRTVPADRLAVARGGALAAIPAVLASQDNDLRQVGDPVWSYSVPPPGHQLPGSAYILPTTANNWRCVGE